MFTVHFLPSDKKVIVSPGTLISDVAIMAGIEDLHLPCGGKGTCSRCLVEIVYGKPEITGDTRLDRALAGKNLVMACQTKVTDDIVVRLTKSRDASMQVLGDSHMLVSEELLPDSKNLSPLYRAEHLTVPEATIESHYSDWQRLTRELSGSDSVRTDANILRILPEALREQNGKITAIVQDEDDAIRVLDIRPGHVPVKSYGLAIDIGTTTIAVQLMNLSDGRTEASRTAYNAQAERGADVISRIDYARTPERQRELRSLVLKTVNELIDQVADDGAVSTQEIRAAFIAANTTMIHLLLAIPPRYIRETPYVPTVNAVPSLTASELGLNIHPQAVVACAPGVGSYVGGDITAGLLCTDIPFNNEEVYLFLDIGTNGEIVLGNSDWMVACACSAGPAFEGSGIKCGMRATTGAIEYVEISDDARYVSFDVIGGGKPVGICGSGLICLLGEMLMRGIIDQSGRFNTELNTPRFVKIDNNDAFIIDWDNDGNPDMVITEADIDNLIRTKAAIYAACSLILSNVGLDWSAISRVIIAGGFGRFIQVQDAIQIGLLPDLPYERFSYIGNSSLTGAYIALLSREKRKALLQISSGMTYIDLSSDPNYMDSYLGAMFLPHTDMTRFPSVADRLKR